MEWAALKRLALPSKTPLLILFFKSIPYNAIVHKASGPCGTPNSEIRVYCL